MCVSAASRAPPAQNGAFGMAAGMNGYASPAMPQPYPYPSMPQAAYNPYPYPPTAAGTVRLMMMTLSSAPVFQY